MLNRVSGKGKWNEKNDSNLAWNFGPDLLYEVIRKLEFWSGKVVALTAMIKISTRGTETSFCNLPVNWIRAVGVTISVDIVNL